MGMILKGDCIEVMNAMKPNSVDAVVCDPPYGLEFMGKEWDKLRNTWQAEEGRYHNDTTFIAKGDRVRYQAGLEMQLWHTQWLTEAYRVLKPGGSMLVMGGTRTSHRLACAIEDSGFIIKDTLMWIYGSGFPKAQDLGKMIDKRNGAERKVIGKRSGTYADIRRDKKTGRDGLHGGIATQRERIESLITAPSTDLAKHWDGFKVGGIKPAYEPIIWAVKPPEGSYVDNVLKWGVGAVNVDECRINHNGRRSPCGADGRVHRTTGNVYGEHKKSEDFNLTNGRFPANVILDEEAGRMLDEQSGNRLGSHPQKTLSGYKGGCHLKFAARKNREIGFNDNGGASRFFYCAKASRGERNAGLEGMEEKECFNLGHKDNPGRNAPKKSYPRQNNHPTVKPIKLFEYLIKLVTREGQVILDPFIGSGTTAIAAHNIGRKCIGIEKEDEYLEIATRRIRHWENQPKQMEMGI